MRDTDKPKIEMPDDYDDESSFLADMRKAFIDDTSYDRLNREAALEDMRFMTGDQWADEVRARREAARKPTLTVNRIPAFVAQIIGERRQNETSLKVSPDGSEDVSEAELREGLLRDIESQSRAEIAYDKALENQVICGIGNFKVELRYDNDDAFEQCIRIGTIRDALSVVWDYRMQDPSGSDAGHVFEVVTMSKKEFSAAWPWATPTDISVDITLRGDLRANGWIAQDEVRVVNYWRMRSRKRTLAMLQDGKTIDITDFEDPEQEGPIAAHPDGRPIVREVDRKYAQLYVCSGTDILEGPYELPIRRVPLFRVPGWEVDVGEWKHRWGLIRFLKDPQRLHNYWRSVIAEKLMLTPRASWIARASAVLGREKDWRNAHLSDDPLLIYNDDAAEAPVRVPAATMEAALLDQAALTVQDIKDVSNMHEANLGMPSNEVSGAAIMARQRVSNTGTVLFHDNLNQAIEEAGRVINDLLPFVYDTPRIIRILGSDGKSKVNKINMGDDPDSIDVTGGKFAVKIMTGPSYATKRIEAANSMMNLINAMPQVASIAADLIVAAQDWPGAEEIARRLRMTLPPGLLSPDEVSPEQAQQAQQQGQAQAQAQQLATAAETAKIEKTQAEAALAATRARHYGVQAELAPHLADIAAAKAASSIDTEQQRLAIDAAKPSRE